MIFTWPFPRIKVIWISTLHACNVSNCNNAILYKDCNLIISCTLYTKSIVSNNKVTMSYFFKEHSISLLLYLYMTHIHTLSSISLQIQSLKQIQRIHQVQRSAAQHLPGRRRWRCSYYLLLLLVLSTANARRRGVVVVVA